MLNLRRAFCSHQRSRLITALEVVKREFLVEVWKCSNLLHAQGRDAPCQHRREPWTRGTWSTCPARQVAPPHEA